MLWGCDAPADEPVFWLDPCPSCGGKRLDCQACDGTNRMPVFRCPQKLATARHRDVLLAALRVESGILPDPGGWQDQANTFVEAFPIAQAEIASWRAKHDELARKRAVGK